VGEAYRDQSPKEDRAMPRNSIVVVAIAAACMAAILAFAPLYETRVAAAEPPIFTGLVSGVAVGGYDPVAYFTAGKPVQGSEKATLRYDGVTWRFASAENRTMFEANPTKYAPQYGGYCAYAVSQGHTAKAEPDAWTIYEGKLYLNYDKSVQAKWAKDIPGYVKKADANWPGVLGQ
jgi:YHS domain-containing protein